jgi:hypothetical protein
MSEFADLAGVSKSQVSYNFNAWQLAADKGQDIARTRRT